MTIKSILPEPTIDYNADRERIRNAGILRLLSDKLDRSKLPQYPGTPVLITHGLSSSFSVPTGAGWTVLQFTNSTYRSNNFLGDIDTSLITLTKAMAFQQQIVLPHVAGVGAAEVACEIGIWLNGAYFKSLYDNVPYDKDSSINLTDYMANLNAGDTIQLRMRHDNAGNFVINMISAIWGLTQLTPDPTYVESRL